MNKYGIITALLIASASLTAQPQAWTFEQCLKQAEEKNITIQRMKVQIDNNEIDLQNAKMSRVPGLDAGISQGFNFGRTKNRAEVMVDQSSANTSFSVGTGIPLFTGMRIPNEIKRAKLSLRAAAQELEQTRENLQLQIASLFLEVIFNQDIVTIAAQQVSLSEEQLAKTEQLVAVGKLAKSEYYQMKSSLAQSKQSWVEANNNLDLAKLNLAQALELDNTDGFTIVSPAISDDLLQGGGLILSKEDIIAHAIEIRPGVAAAKTRIEESRRNIKIAQSGYYPTLNLSGSYGNGFYHSFGSNLDVLNTPFPEQVKKNGSFGIGLSLSIPIFDKFSTRNRVKQSRNALVLQEMTLTQTVKDLKKEIEQAFLSAQGAFARFQSAQESLTGAQDAYSSLKERYDNGKTTAIEINESRLKLGKAQSELTQAKYNYVMRVKILDFYAGKPLQM